MRQQGWRSEPQSPHRTPVLPSPRACAPPPPPGSLRRAQSPHKTTKHRTPFGSPLPALRQMGRALTLCGTLSGRASCALAKQLHSPGSSPPPTSPRLPGLVRTCPWEGPAQGREAETHVCSQGVGHRNEGTEADVTKETLRPGDGPHHGTDQHTDPPGEAAVEESGAPETLLDPVRCAPGSSGPVTHTPRMLAPKVFRIRDWSGKREAGAVERERSPSDLGPNPSSPM